MWFCVYTGEEEIKDASGNYTGEKTRTYDPPQRILANVSPARGTVGIEAFGNDDSYDRIIALAWDDLAVIYSPFDYNGLESSDDYLFSVGGINDSTVWYVDKTPVNDDPNDYDYIVHRIAKSINGVLIAVKKVNNSAYA